MDSDQGLVGPFRSVERLFELCWWDVVEVAVQAVVVVPVDPAQRGELEVLDRLPRAALARGATDQFGLVIAVHGLGQRVIVRIADSADRGHRADLSQTLAVANRGELTAGIAHEIQNPLNFVNNFAELNTELVKEIDEQLAIGNEQYAKGNPQQAIAHLQQAKDLIKDIKANSDKINHHGKRAESIVKGMLEHSRTSTGQKEWTDINALAAEYLRLSYQGLRAKSNNFNSEIITDFEPNLPKVQVVSQDIGRVLLNLINNGFQAINEKIKSGVKDYKPALTVSTKMQFNKILISIKDNGPGIPEDIRDKIFQPFFTTKPTGQGTGLGLSLAYDIVKAHGGMIQVNTNYHPLVATPNETNKVYQPETSTEFIISLKVDGQDQLS